MLPVHTMHSSSNRSNHQETIMVEELEGKMIYLTLAMIMTMELEHQCSFNKVLNIIKFKP
jgi:hypothetical protein